MAMVKRMKGVWLKLADHNGQNGFYLLAIVAEKLKVFNEESMQNVSLHPFSCTVFKAKSAKRTSGSFSAQSFIYSNTIIRFGLLI